MVSCVGDRESDGLLCESVPSLRTCRVLRPFPKAECNQQASKDQDGLETSHGNCGVVNLHKSLSKLMTRETSISTRNFVRYPKLELALGFNDKPLSIWMMITEWRSLCDNSLSSQPQKYRVAQNSIFRIAQSAGVYWIFTYLYARPLYCFFPATKTSHTPCPVSDLMPDATIK
jgi:hypothetical protein